MERPNGCLVCLAIGILLLSLPVHESYSQAYDIGAAINSTLDYVNIVNQSAYLLFYPNLTASYGYIGRAMNVSQTDPAYGYALLDMAMGSARQQLDMINRYRTASFCALAAATAVLAVLLNRLMKPRRAR